MGILMKEITLKLSRKAIHPFEGIAEQLRSEGMTDNEIIKIFNTHVKCKEMQFYRKMDGPRLIKDALAKLELQTSADSKAEIIFEMALWRGKIRFNTQYKIGPYRADFLIDKFLVVEIDGPIHSTLKQKRHDEVRDKYIEGLGYKVLRLPIWLISMSVESVILEIKDIIKNGGVANG